MKQLLFERTTGQGPTTERVVLRAPDSSGWTAFHFRGVSGAELYGCGGNPDELVRRSQRGVEKPPPSARLGATAGDGKIVVRRRSCVIASLSLSTDTESVSVAAVSDLGRVLEGGRGQGAHGQLCLPPWPGWAVAAPARLRGWLEERDPRSHPRSHER